MSTGIKYSIIVPAYKECANIRPLTERLFAAFKTPNTAVGKQQQSIELLIVDDNSRDGSEECVNQLRKDGFPVRIIVRTKERGLSSAVLRGFQESRGEYLLCMDADLQHPPERVPYLLAKLDPSLPFSDQQQQPGQETEELRPKSKLKQQDDGAEFAIGTRYYPGDVNAIDKDWPLYRRIISSGARLMARPLTPLSDPMTGFFAIRRDVFQRATRIPGLINPIGFKIALELFVKCRVRRHAEIPIVFGVRVHGESKLSSKVIVGYLRHLRELYSFVYPGLVEFIVVIVVIFLVFLVNKVL